MKMEVVTLFLGVLLGFGLFFCSQKAWRFFKTRTKPKQSVPIHKWDRIAFVVPDDVLLLLPEPYRGKAKKILDSLSEVGGTRMLAELAHVHESRNLFTDFPAIIAELETRNVIDVVRPEGIVRFSPSTWVKNRQNVFVER